MKKRELIKPDLNPPFTRLCREEIKPTLKLFEHDLSKHMKDMSRATIVSKQMQKHCQSAKPHFGQKIDVRTTNLSYRSQNSGE